MEAEKKDALADRDDTSIYNLAKSLVDFLLYVMQDLCFLHGPWGLGPCVSRQADPPPRKETGGG